MVRAIKDFMTTNIQTLPSNATIREAAQKMRDSGIGDVLVTEAGVLYGLLTDRDIVVRSIAEGKDPAETPIGAICSRNLASLSPEDGAEEAVELMSRRSVRRLPVVENGKPLGIVSLGDLALEFDERSVLAAISAAAANC